MTLRQSAILVLAVFALGACRKRQTAAAPAGQTTSAEETARRDREARARADSVAAADAARAGERTLRETELRAAESLQEPIYFEYDSDALSAEAEDRLRGKAEVMRANPRMQLRIEGHTDERGSTEYNLALGQRRAEAVRTFLVNYGIPAVRLAVISFGEERPAEEGGDEASLARNRRAEFVVTAGGAR
jgi:peptidoglycan-associated lipoprotein